MNFTVVDEAAWEAAYPRRKGARRRPEIEPLLDALAAGEYVQVRYGSPQERRGLVVALGWGAKRRGLLLDWREGRDGTLIYRAVRRPEGAA